MAECIRCLTSYPNMVRKFVCKKCNSTEDRNRYLKNREKILTEKKIYNKTDKCKEALKKYYYKNKSTEKYKILQRKSINKYAEKYPIKISAHQKLNDALRRGKIIKELCSICFTDKLVQGHHDDYTKPLDVIWLCVKHHVARHKYLKSINHDLKGE